MFIGRLFDIPIKLSFGFLILAVFYAAIGLVVPLLTVILALFLHEMAHALAARTFGVRVQRVEVLPFGGQAVIEDIMALRPEKEMIVALAGPATSLALAGVSYFLQGWPLMHTFMLSNLYLALFNLLPGLPLDGGRFARSALSILIGFKPATRIMAGAGQLWGGLLAAGGVTGLFFHYPEAVNPLVIGIILFYAAHREKNLIYFSFVRYLLHKQGILDREGQVMARPVVARGQTLVKNLLTRTSPSDYLVVIVSSRNGNLNGVIPEETLVEQYINQGPQLKVEDCLPRHSAL